MPVRILLVEDDEHIRGAVEAFLVEAGYAVDVCADGTEAHIKLHENSYQLAIFDIMLPGLSGRQLLRAFRAISDAPVVMLTALADDSSQIQAFEAEADDYITKPFKIQLLLKRIEALLRRSGALSKELVCGDLTLLPDNYTALYAGEALPLTLKEFELLLLLLKNKSRTLTYETLLSRIWGWDFSGDASTVHTHIKNLRAKLPADLITTVRGVGYRVEEKQG